MASTSSRPDVVAAGVVVFRPGREVLLVHRPRYDDWSFPKGKVDPGEHVTTTAVREVAEETGLHVRLGPALPTMTYRTGGRDKRVHYWVGRAVGDDDVSTYEPNEEIDQVAWVDRDEAAEVLTYERDRALLADALKVRKRSHALVVLRHGKARSRKTWRRPDPERPLLAAGHEQAFRLVPTLAAYDVSRIVTSPSLRCSQTVAPFAETVGLALEAEPVLSEEGAAEGDAAALVTDLVAAVEQQRRGLVVCTHRPVLPACFEGLGLEDPGLDPGEMLVAHLRKGRVVATERHLVF